MKRRYPLSSALPFVISAVFVACSGVGNNAAGSEPAVRTLKGHDATVYAIAFSPDGRLLASGDANGAMKIWDVATGKQVRGVAAHSELVHAIVFSPDGHWLVSGSAGWAFDENAQSEVKVWEVSTGREVRSLPYRGGVGALAFSPNGKHLAAADGNRVKLLQVDPWAEVLVLEGHPRRVRGLAFSPDGSLLASWSQSEDDTIKLWNPATGELVRTLEGHHSEVMGVMTTVFSPNGRWLAASSDQLGVRVWEVSTGREVNTYEGKPEAGYTESATISPDGRWLLTEGNGPAVDWWEITTNRIKKAFGHKGQTGSFTFSPDQKLLASSGGQDHTIKLWNVLPSEATSIWPDGN